MNNHAKRGRNQVPMLNWSSHRTTLAGVNLAPLLLSVKSGMASEIPSILSLKAENSLNWRQILFFRNSCAMSPTSTRRHLYDGL